MRAKKNSARTTNVLCILINSQRRYADVELDLVVVYSKIRFFTLVVHNLRLGKWKSPLHRSMSHLPPSSSSHMVREQVSDEQLS
jgi:hypothetical protein